jgi:DNA-binding transcriptional MerR regulator
MGSAKAKLAPAKNVRTADIVIPDRLYFRIGEVAKLCHLPAYVLRFWETEFPSLAPKKSSKGQRLFRKADVENVLRIKKLLYEEGFTIAGARQHLKVQLKPHKAQNTLPFLVTNGTSPELKKIRSELQQIMQMLSRKR